MEQQTGSDPDEAIDDAQAASPGHGPGESGDESVPAGAADPLTTDIEPRALHAAAPVAHPSPWVATDRGTRRPVAFLAELARAMHAAAEAERAAVLERSRVDAHAFAEHVQMRSTDEAAALKRSADEDVAAIREWSKAEIARIREETERRIAARRHELDEQIDRHAASIERRLESVRGRVEVFEAEMSRFFEQLLEEQDPSLFAQMAASLPEPPTFEELEFEADLADEIAGQSAVDGEGDLPAAAEASEEVTARLELLQGPESETASGQDGEAAVTPAGESINDEASEPRSDLGADSPSGFAEAEAAAAADAAADGGAVDASDSGNSDQGGAAWAARLAGLIGYGHAPTAEAPAAAATAGTESQTTQVIVIGLVSVASIAGFKRQLGHLPGVVSVGVSSGPDGEFVFRVTHASDLVVRDAVPTIPGFQARIVSSGPGIVHVSARDPEAES